MTPKKIRREYRNVQIKFMKNGWVVESLFLDYEPSSVGKPVGTVGQESMIYTTFDELKEALVTMLTEHEEAK